MILPYSRLLHAIAGYIINIKRNGRAHAQNKMTENAKKCKKNAEKFAYVKKKQYLCIRFWETSVFRFSTGGPDIKIQILDWGPNFFAPNRRKDEANWKIDTISVVQELK